MALNACQRVSASRAHSAERESTRGQSRESVYPPKAKQTSSWLFHYTVFFEFCLTFSGLPREYLYGIFQPIYRTLKKG